MRRRARRTILLGYLGLRGRSFLKEFMNYVNRYFHRLRMKNFLPEMLSVHDAFREIP